MNQELIREKTGKANTYDFESEQNLIGFFSMLYKIDKKNNPDLYTKESLPESKQTKL